MATAQLRRDRQRRYSARNEILDEQCGGDAARVLLDKMMRVALANWTLQLPKGLPPFGRSVAPSQLNVSDVRPTTARARARMYVFIDEAGGFQVPTRPNQVSCVAALVIPETFARTLFRKVRRDLGWWRVGDREVKGSQLDERRMAELVRVVRRFDVLLIGVAIDMGLHTEAGLS